MEPIHALTVRTRIWAFTLTELLVTIAILGVLSSFVLTVVVKGNGKSRDIQCKSNLRQKGIALQDFVTEQSVYPIIINPRYLNGSFPEQSSPFTAALKDHGLGPLPQDGSLEPSVYSCPSGFRQLEGFPRSWALGYVCLQCAWA